MARLGPFEPAPALAVAVSGGPDSLALALLARDWVLPRGGTVTALVVDHGLRPESAAEARQTVGRLAARSIPGRLLTFTGLARGPALAERARDARHAALAAACAQAGILHLLLGHHLADQAETLLMRARAGSGPRGLAGMAALAEHHDVRLLRPLLATPPAALRALLTARGLDWIDDPSNRDPATLRARLRAELAGQGGQVATLAAAAAAHAAARAEQDQALATLLAARATLHPAGWAHLTAGPLPPAALDALLRSIAGRRHPLPAAALARLAAAPHAATLGGARLMPARQGGWWVLREAAAMAPPIPAEAGAVWDRRFRLRADPGPGLTLGALASDAPAWRAQAPPGWPAALLRTLPALRRGPAVIAVLALGPSPAPLAFHPPMPLAGAPFRPL